MGPVAKALGLCPSANVMNMHTGLAVQGFGAADAVAGVRGWILWPGVTLMVVDAITSLILIVPWKSTMLSMLDLVPAARSTRFRNDPARDSTEDDVLMMPQQEDPSEDAFGEKIEKVGEPDVVEPESIDHPDHVPTAWWVGGLVLSGTITTVVMSIMFDLAPWQPLLGASSPGPRG